jgi:phosphate transport system permease protein
LPQTSALADASAGHAAVADPVAGSERVVVARGTARGFGQRAPALVPRPLLERVYALGLFLCAFASVLAALAIVLVLGGETFQFIRLASMRGLLWDAAWNPLFRDGHFGMGPLLVGTISTSAIALGIASPLGLLAAIYLSEFATSAQRRVFEPTLAVLAGVPSIVYGYIALVFVTPGLQRLIPGLSGLSALSAGVVLGIALIPAISSLAAAALLGVPRELREGAQALGIGRLGIIFSVVLPTARADLASAMIVAASRAMGETMIVAIAAGQDPHLTFDPRLPVQTLTAYLIQGNRGGMPSGTPQYLSLFVVGATLFALTCCMGAARRYLARSRREIALGGEPR